MIRLRDKSSSEGGGAYAQDKNTSAGLCAKNAGGGLCARGGVFAEHLVLASGHVLQTCLASYDVSSHDDLVFAVQLLGILHLS